MPTFPLKLGSTGQLVTDLSRAAARRYASYAFEIDGQTPLKADGYFGRGEQAFATAWQTRTNRPVTGQISEDEFNYIVKGIAFPATSQWRPGHWIYTCPGSGADANVGPSFEVGVWAEKVYRIRHQPVKFIKGGYLGLLGGDAKASYVEVTYDQYKSLEWLLDNNPDVQRAMQLIAAGSAPAQAIAATDLHLIFSAYSQSADGLEDALEILFGDGGFVIPKTGETTTRGKYADIRDAIRRVIQFGNPSRQPGQMSGQPGWNPKGWGISRKRRPLWLLKVTVSITNPGDFYACVPDSDGIRPPFYGEIIHAETELPYFVHVLNLAVPIIAKYFGIVGQLFTPLAPVLVAGIAGLNLIPAFTRLFGQAQETSFHTAVDAELTALLEPMGVLTHLDDLVALVAALPGLQAHGEYWVPKPEMGNRSGIQVGCDEIRLLYP
ncbi:peptidoglycan-binding protein [Mycobacterium hackensackense]|uniref:peptidoglycan-binding protein n=1 Tax=Mycobacterium hackensackense TaxID=228909 RepID=UPI002265AF9B|nr:peptidoglycan-binding protein [Mycobacterium hackensackense]MCV7255362.1 peptidoglycan-binding protein [Mycobacterium hackensackense]